MGAPKDPNISSSDRIKWNKIFNALVQMLQKQQSQLKFLEDRLKLQHDRWVSDVNLHQEKLSQMRRNIKVHKMDRTVESKKSDLFINLKQTEALIYKLNLENTQSELADFKVWFDLLSRKCSKPKLSSLNDSKKGEEQHKAMENELRRLKHENKKLGSKKISELSALLSERDFAWNQYKELESDLTDQLRGKHAEVKQVNEKIEKLLASMEQLKSSNNQKDGVILSLKADMTELESDSLRKTEEISRLSRELELLRKARSDSETPVLRRCIAEAGRSQLGGKNNGVQSMHITVKKSSQVIEKGSGNSKRKTVASTSVAETPKLFSSRFKIPKLKSSPCTT